MIAADETYPRTTIDLPDGGTLHTTSKKRYIGITNGEAVDYGDAVSQVEGDLVFDKQTNRFARRNDPGSGTGARRLESWDPNAWGVNAAA